MKLVDLDHKVRMIAHFKKTYERPDVSEDVKKMMVHQSLRIDREIFDFIYHPQFDSRIIGTINRLCRKYKVGKFLKEIRDASV